MGPPKQRTFSGWSQNCGVRGSEPGQGPRYSCWPQDVGAHLQGPEKAQGAPGTSQLAASKEAGTLVLQAQLDSASTRVSLQTDPFLSSSREPSWPTAGL